MNKTDTGRLLAMCASVDARFREKSQDDLMRKVLMWYECLDSDMDFEWASKHLTKHYATNDKAVMPADFNVPWRAHVRVLKEKMLMNERHLQIAAARSKAGMPESVRVRLTEMGVLRP